MKPIWNRMIGIIYSMIIILATGCQNNDPVPFDWTPTLLGKGDLKVIIGFQDTWIITKQNQSEWNNSWVNTLNSQNIGVLETNIDWDKYQILILVDGLKGSVGYGIEITSVTENETNLAITVEHTSPSLSNQKEVTQPYCIVKLPISSKPIVFEHKSPSPYIYPSLIGRGILKGNGGIPKQDITITNQTDWINLLTQMNLDVDINLIEYYPKIDFEKFIVIATFEKFDCVYPGCPNRYIDITDIIENETNIGVIVQNLFVVLGEGYPQPFHIVQIPKTNKPIVFEHK